MRVGNQPFEITSIADEHIVPLQQFLHDVWSLSYQHTLGQSLIEELTADLHTKKRLHDEIGDDCKLSLGAFADTRLIGHVMAAFEGPQNVYIGRLYVDPDFQGQGVGRLLLQAAEAAFEDATSATLEVFEDSFAAVKFYEHMGYEQVGRNVSNHNALKELFDLHFIKSL